MPRIALGIEYDGSKYYGWQKQNNVPSIQASLESSISKVADHNVNVYCAGRTDAGVHAVGQVIHFETSSLRPVKAWFYGVNSNLPYDIRVKWAREVDSDFHARFSAVSRKYTYFIYNHIVPIAIFRKQVSWFYESQLDVSLMNEAASYLIGEHDFTSFRSSGCQARTANRCINAFDVKRKNNLVVIEVEANAFLLHMVRNIVGVLIEVGIGKKPPAWAKEVLLACDRKLGGSVKTAPSQGLYLTKVTYEAKWDSINALSESSFNFYF